MPGVSKNNPVLNAINTAAQNRQAARGSGVLDIQKKPPVSATTPDKTNEVQTKKSDTANDSNVVTGSNSDATDPTKRQWNPLSMYSSSTYKISLYMITPEATETFAKTNKWDLKSMLLLMQSGGHTPGVDTNRATYFDNDLYIDNLEITTVIGSKETGTASTSYEFRFQIFEPYGFSFTTNLINAALQMQELTNRKREIKQPLNALQVDYLIAIHFYGYDSEGHVTNGPPDAQGHSTGVAGGAAFERMFPVSIVRMSSRLDSKTTVYDVTAYMTGQQVGFSKGRSVMSEAMTISATTVKEALDSVAKLLNQKQKLKSGNGDSFKQEVADEYEFVFDSTGSIDNALIVDKNHFVPGNAPMPDVTKPLGINVRLSESGKSDIVKKQSRSIQIPDGTTMMSLIDQIISQSTFLSDALKVVDIEELDKVKTTDKSATTNASPKPLYWFHVTPQVVPLKYDNKRKEMAYKVTYIIQRKQVPYVRTVVASTTTTYMGAYKKYDYWYTGKNAEVLSYDQTFNLLYFVTAPASSEAGTPASNEVAPVKSTTVSDGSSVGRLPNSNEGVAAVKTSLYSPADNLMANIKILGDPDFLMTSEAGSIDTVTKQWYGDDFTINPGSSQVFVEIGFNQVTDYDTTLGYMEPNNRIFFWDYPEDIKKKTDNCMIYMVIGVKSRFSKGLFTQELRTVVPPFFADPKTPQEERPAAQSGGKKLSQQELAALQRKPGSGSSYKPIPNKPAPETFKSLVSDQAGNDLIVKKSTSPLINTYGRK